MWIRRLDLKYIQPGSSKAHESEWDGPELQYNLPTTLAYLLSPVALHLGLVLFHQSNRVARSPRPRRIFSAFKIQLPKTRTVFPLPPSQYFPNFRVRLDPPILNPKQKFNPCRNSQQFSHASQFSYWVVSASRSRYRKLALEYWFKKSQERMVRVMHAQD
jgi:hypothetical protein